MADYKKIIPLILKYEGGLSKDIRDSASRNPAPWPYKGSLGWHTNKGVTFSAFNNLASKLGYQVTPDNFFNMPSEIWEKIFKNGYWDAFGLDNMNSEAIAGFIANATWGSGAGGAFKLLKAYLATQGVNVNTSAEITPAFNKLSDKDEAKIFEDLIKVREAFFRSLNKPEFLTGWLNRNEAIKNWGETELKKKL